MCYNRSAVGAQGDPPLKLLLATDAWHPQVNGVVRTLSAVIDELRKRGHIVEVVAVGDYPDIPLPSYPEIRLAYWFKGLSRRIEAFDPDAIHICTEGPVGFMVRRYCLRQGLSFTTSFHTRFPEYVHGRFPIPIDRGYSLIRRFHDPARCTLVPTASVAQDLQTRGFQHLKVWSRGVDTTLFRPELRTSMPLPRPIMLNVGRVVLDKNLEAFLDLDLPGTRVVVGDGPQLRELRKRYPDAIFTGFRHGEELARYYASADVFVFPSLTDTFGLVMLEAIACGTPVAAFPVTGPVDVLEQGVTGFMHEDLAIATTRALKLERDSCARIAKDYPWWKTAHQLLQALVPVSKDKITTVNGVIE